MRSVLESVCGWLLSACGAPEHLQGDLLELAAKRSTLWLVREVIRSALVLAAIRVRRRPVQSAWLTVLIAAGSLGAMQVAVEATRPSSRVAIGLSLLDSAWIPTAATTGDWRLVPSARVRLINVTTERLQDVQFVAVFFRARDGLVFGEVRGRLGSDDSPLGPGAETVMTLAAQNGYLASETPTSMLRNSQFGDAVARVSVRVQHGTWARLGDLPIKRILSTRLDRPGH